MENAEIGSLSEEEVQDIRDVLKTKNLRRLFIDVEKLLPKNIQLSYFQILELLEIDLSAYDSFQRTGILGRVRSVVTYIKKVYRKKGWNFIDVPQKDGISYHGFSDNDIGKLRGNIVKYDTLKSVAARSADIARKLGTRDIRKLQKRMQRGDKSIIKDRHQLHVVKSEPEDFEDQVVSR